jgi:hypothetical protein
MPRLKRATIVEGQTLELPAGGRVVLLSLGSRKNDRSIVVGIEGEFSIVKDRRPRKPPLRAYPMPKTEPPA